MTTVAVIAFALVIAVAGAAIGLFVRPAVFFSLALGASVLSGNWDRIGVPLGVDRVLVLAGLGALVLGVTVSPRPLGARRLRPVEVLMIVLVAVVIGSAIVAGTLTQTESFYALLDRLGIIPFVGFALADRVFGSDEDRRFLVGIMTVVGAYLALTAIFEMVGATALVFPKYVNNPLIGTHWGRARGPFLEAGANGLALFECAVAAAIGLRVFRHRRTKQAALVVICLCAVGVLLTLTRADWIGAVAGGAVGCLLYRPARRWLVPMLAGGAVLVFAAVLLIPGLSSKVADRAGNEKTVWDRQNTDDTALRMVEAHPLFGVGWQKFLAENNDYARQADGYPMSSTIVGVHNVVLSYVAELGLVGGVLWVAVVWLGAAAAWRGGSAMAPEWRAAALAILVNWLVVGSFQPLAFAFPNLCVWLWLGIAAAPTARRLDPSARRTVKQGVTTPWAT
jgi:putative inorganic carbon (HCO3(-)) transporter